MSHPDQEILEVVGRAFSFPKKPSPGPSRGHCDDCTEMYDYIVRLNPSDVTLEEIHDRWQFDGCGKEYKKYLFPGICRECLDGDALGLYILFSYIDGMGKLSDLQRDGLARLYQYLFDCGFALDEPQLHQDLRERLSETKSEPVGPANGSQPICSETNQTSSAAGSRPLT